MMNRLVNIRSAQKGRHPVVEGAPDKGLRPTGRFDLLGFRRVTTSALSYERWTCGERSDG